MYYQVVYSTDAVKSYFDSHTKTSTLRPNEVLTCTKRPVSAVWSDYSYSSNFGLITPAVTLI